jgi:hypothetical protein
VVDNDDVKAGVQIAVENSSVGDHTKVAIRSAMQDKPRGLGKEMGNPLRNPWCIEWQSHPESKEPGKKYAAVRLPEMPLSREVARLIDETEPPDIEGLTMPPAWASVRATLERAALVDMPWDDWFPELPDDDKKLLQRAHAAPEVGRSNGAPQAAPRTVQGSRPDPRLQAQPQARPAAPQAPQSMAEVGRALCENPRCSNMVLDTETSCAVCGFQFTDVPQPPPVRRRGGPPPEATSPEHQQQTPQEAPRPAQASARRQVAPQPPPQRRPAPQAFDDFPFGANVQESGELEDTGLLPSDPLPWGKR